MRSLQSTEYMHEKTFKRYLKNELWFLNRIFLQVLEQEKQSKFQFTGIWQSCLHIAAPRSQMGLLKIFKRDWFVFSVFPNCRGGGSRGEISSSNSFVQETKSPFWATRCQASSASLPCFTAVLPFALEGYELLSQYNFQYSTGADLLWHFNGLLWHGGDPPKACFPTADCYTEVICLDFQLTGNIWSVLLRPLLERTYGGASWGKAAAALAGMPKPSANASMQLSVGVEVFAPDRKQPPTVTSTEQSNLRTRGNYCHCKNTDRVMEENTRKQRLWWEAV